MHHGRGGAGLKRMTWMCDSGEAYPGDLRGGSEDSEERKGLDGLCGTLQRTIALPFVGGAYRESPRLSGGRIERGPAARIGEIICAPRVLFGRRGLIATLRVAQPIGPKTHILFGEYPGPYPSWIRMIAEQVRDAV